MNIFYPALRSCANAAPKTVSAMLTVMWMLTGSVSAGVNDPGGDATNSVYSITAVNADGPETDNPQTQTNLFVFKISRSGGTNALMASVGWQVQGAPTNSADGQDFEFGGVLPGGFVNFSLGQVETNIAIRVRGDLEVEPDEHFVVALTNAATGGTIGSPGTATGVIRNDDSSGGSTNSLNLNVAFSKRRGYLNLGTGGGVSAAAGHLTGSAFGKGFGLVSFGNGSPTNGMSYSNVGGDIGVNVDGQGILSGFAYSRSLGVIQFDWPGAGSTNQPRVDLANGKVTGSAFSPSLGWLDFGVVLGSVNIDTNTNSIFSISVVNADRPETDDPQTQTNLLVFKISRSGDTNASMASVGWQVQGAPTNSADGQDFEFGGVLPSGFVNFSSGQLETNITIRVRGDLDVEADEHFVVALTNAATDGVIGSPSTATGVIRNDDSASIFTISSVDADRPESDDPLTQTNLFVFKISRSGNTNHSMAAVGWTVAVTPTNTADGFDFNEFGILLGNSVFFAPGQTETNISVHVSGDLTVESDETFLVALTNARFGGVIGSPAAALGVIRNDDTAPPPPAPPLLVLRPSVADSFDMDGAFRFEITGNVGTEYAVEASDDIKAQFWVPVGIITGNGTPQLILDTGSVAMPYRFYRAIPLPPLVP